LQSITPNFIVPAFAKQFTANDIECFASISE